MTPKRPKPTYAQRSEIPTVEEFRQLRIACGLSPRAVEAATKGLPNSLFATAIRDQGKLIAMGRVVGDGGCNFAPTGPDPANSLI